MPDQSVTIVGALGCDPELRYTAAGRPLCNFSVATSERWQDKVSGEWQEKTTWFNCVAWGDIGENIAASMRKGHRIVATGKIQTRQWETDTGEKRYGWDLNVTEAGPSLRWAQATVETTTRETYGGEQTTPPVPAEGEPF